MTLAAFFLPDHDFVGQCAEHDHDHDGHDHDGADEDLAASYSMSLHLLGVLIMLTSSLLGTVIPLLGVRLSILKVHPNILWFGRAIGTGVILSTAFIHMLVPSVEALASECLPESFRESYPSLTGLVALGTIFLSQILELSLTSKFVAQNSISGQQGLMHTHSHSALTAGGHHSHFDDSEDPAAKAALLADANGDGNEHIDSSEHNHDAHGHGTNGHANHDHGSNGHASHDHGTNGHASHDHGTNGHAAEGQIAAPSHTYLNLGGDAAKATDDRQLDKKPLTKEVVEYESEEARFQHSRSRLLAVILEIGITMHSVVIGISLGVLAGSEFVTLLIAIVFHQFFEGFALASNVVDAHFPKTSTVVAMLLTYALCTPIGMLVGIGIHSTYDPDSPTALIVQGIFDAVSAGILIYNGLVELLTYQFTNNPEFRRLKLPIRILVLVGMYFGATVMSVIGKFA